MIILPHEMRVRLRTQTNKWSCGPNALRNALLCYGVVASVRRLADEAKLSRDFDFANLDTTPYLSKAAGVHGFSLDQHIYTTHLTAKLSIKNWIENRIPVLVCVDRWDHWVCVAGARARHVFYLDSERPGPVPQLTTWDEFLSRANRWRPNESRFDLYPVRDARVKKDGRLQSDTP